MKEQFLTVEGLYRNGKIESQSKLLPKDSFRVLITFLEPIPDGTGTSTRLDLTQEEINKFVIGRFGITDRELEILQMVHKGCTNREISEKLELGSGTVRNYISSLLDKFKATDRTQLVKLAIEKGILH
jgi:DNA-binding NarL/FixJ family response regulator